MWRTMSRKIDANDQPDTSCADILEGHVRAIGLAEKFIYIENQYLRDGTIGQALVDRMSAVKDLNLILVLPAVSEEMMESADPISLTGVALQFKIIEKLLAFGDRFGAFAMLAPLDPPTKKGDPKIDVIYVHNKLMIVDDVFAVAGSANLNERGTKLDFELDLAWHSPKSVKALRVSLWTEILGKDAKFSQWKPAAYAKSWSDLATKNAGRAPTKRKGFVMPLTNEEGFDLPLVPNWLAQTGDPGRGALRIAGLA
jgi:phosphatidylserine/phosphatidylglycerophosphate/cardiolipin synthase-like enzyme